MKLSKKALDLIIQFEVGGGQKYYDKFLASPSWPGGASGVTIGIGYDLGYDKNLQSDWAGKISSTNLLKLKRCLGVTGSRAKAALSGVRDIVIPWDAAMDVFEVFTLPTYIAQTIKAFPYADHLPDDAFGALVSLVFNRGPLVDASDRRREMRAIKNILLGSKGEITAEVLEDIADQIRAMSRLWPNNLKSDNDLFDRRHREADLVLSCIS